MAVQLKGTVCMAVNQDSMYVVIEGSQSPGGGDGLLTLIKAEHPTMDAGNNTWTVVSTMPARSVWDDYDVFPEIRSASCSLDKTGVFTLRLLDGSGLRYDPMAKKTPQYQTCSSDSNGLGEWRRAFLVTPTEEFIFKKYVIRPEIVVADNGNSGFYNYGDEVVITQLDLGTHCYFIVRLSLDGSDTPLA
ncbi:hypothetical protein CPB97_009913 [Podila verticillata]|nr:hypothetical protein CPB97_009913 [Podila verticillata]